MCLTERQTEFVPGRRTKMCFKLRFTRAQGGCLAERQTEFVPDRRAKDEERGREPTVERLDRGIVRLKEF